MTEEDSLLLTIAFAIRKTALRPRNRDASINDREADLAARTILEHLKLCGYTFTPGPGAPLHSTPKSIE